VDLDGWVEGERTIAIGVLDDEVLVEHGDLEGDGLSHGLWGSSEIIAPQRGVDPNVVSVGRGDEEADDVGAASIEVVDLELHVERGGVAVGERSPLNERAQASLDARILSVGEEVLVGGAEGVAISLEGVGRYLVLLSSSEGRCVDEGEVGHVEEVVGEESRCTGGRRDGEVPPLEGGIIGHGDVGERGARWTDRHEDQSVRLGHVVRCGEPSSTREMSGVAEGGNVDAGSRAVELPAVVAASERSCVVASPEGQRGEPMGALVEEGGDGAVA